jgi:HD-GYP domain-containing protein (c-di-GMP phosphodiesterase class II)
VNNTLSIQSSLPDQFASVMCGIEQPLIERRALMAPICARVETAALLLLAQNIDGGRSKAHSTRVGILAARLGSKLGLAMIDVAALHLAACLHDVGKFFVDKAILRSPFALSEKSRALMQTHTTKGEALLANASCPTIRRAAQVARHHHERWDGTGYPDRLKGDDIPLLARITALADVYDALRSERSYKQAWSHEDAAAEIAAGRGTQFDPRLTDVFLQMVNEDAGSVSRRRAPLLGRVRSAFTLKEIRV